MRSLEMGQLNPEEMRFTTIEFPKDIEIVAKLQKKLREYRERLQSLDKDQTVSGTSIPPEEIDHWKKDTNNKILILGKLLLEGEVDGGKLAQELSEKDPDAFDSKSFHNNLDTIADYAATGGRNIGGGTGLK